MQNIRQNRKFSSPLKGGFRTFDLGVIWATLLHGLAMNITY